MENNVNTRDQKNVGIWLIVLVILFVAFLYALGIGHAPGENPTAQGDETPAATPPVKLDDLSSNDSRFSVNQPVGVVEHPGTVGENQKFLSGRGNTPLPPTNPPAPPNPWDATTGTSAPAAAPAAIPPPTKL